MAGDRMLGTVPDADGDTVEVWLNDDETVSLILLSADEPAITFHPADLDAVRELLDRAAMPGQPEAEADDSCPIEAVLPDGHHPCTLKRGHDGKHAFADEGTWR